MEEKQSLSVQPHEIGDLETVKKANSVEKIKKATICGNCQLKLVSYPSSYESLIQLSNIQSKTIDV